ncbi:MAG: ABC transporter ATP-binding protein [FCB group bacterium]|nr:ABC transporter ATP-binding protein [FCB group bacterium]
MTADTAVFINDLVVKYGDTIALDGLSLEIPNRGVFGLLGKNGAGKTTTIRAIIGLVKQESGTITVLDKYPCSSAFDRGNISVLFAEDGLVSSLTSMENLTIWCGFHGLDKQMGKDHAKRILKKMDIYHYRDTKVKELSTGNKRLLGLARAFMLPSEMVILDEPTASLDPGRAEEVRRAIRILAGTRLVLLSTHNLTEAEDLCDTVAIIDNGKLVISGRPGDLDKVTDKYALRSETGKIVFRNETFESDKDGKIIMNCIDDPADMLRELIDAGNRITYFRQYRRNLSSIFIELTKGDS